MTVSYTRIFGHFFMISQALRNFSSLLKKKHNSIKEINDVQ